MAIKILSKKKSPVSIYPVKVECDECETVFECDEEDTYIGAWGARHVKCPVCGEENMLDTDDGIELTKDILSFPTHYRKTGDKAVKLDDDEIDKYVRECIEHLRTIGKDEYWGTFAGCGDTMIFVFKMDGDEEYYIYVGKNGYETNIPFRSEDYT